MNNEEIAALLGFVLKQLPGGRVEIPVEDLSNGLPYTEIKVFEDPSKNVFVVMVQ